MATLTVYYGSVAKHLETANTMFSFIWWIIGFYWVSAGGETLTRDSPQLYWFVRTYFPSMCFSVQDFSWWSIRLFMCVYVLQALHYIFGIRRVLCCYLCCCGMHYWCCCLLLSALYHCNLICSGRSGSLLWSIFFSPVEGQLAIKDLIWYFLSFVLAIEK